MMLSTEVRLKSLTLSSAKGDRTWALPPAAKMGETFCHPINDLVYVYYTSII